MVDGARYDGDGNLRLVLATWIYRLHQRGVDPADEALAAACAKVDTATDTASGDAAGEVLVEAVSERVGSGAEPDAVAALAHQLYGDDLATDLGEGTRADRIARVRRYQFDRSLPWVARILERRDGHVAPSWLLVERATDRVHALDPNPWNDVDETRYLPLRDFLVLWELDGCTSLRVR